MKMLARSLFAAVIAAAFVGPAMAADNVTPQGSVNTNFRSKDIGSGTPLQVPFQIPSDVSGNPLFSTGNPGVVSMTSLPAFAQIPSFNLFQVGGTSLTLGQKASTASIPVVLPSDGTQATAANQVIQNTALGTPSDPAYNGSNTATQAALLKAIVLQAAPTSLPGTSISSSTQVPGFQGVTGGIPVAITGTVTTQSSASMASPAYRIAVSVSGNNAQSFASGAKRMLSATLCNKTSPAADRVLKFYDKASTPVPGTDSIVTTIFVPGGACASIDYAGGGFPFTNGVAVAITLPGDSDTGSTVAAGDIQGLNIQHN